MTVDFNLVGGRYLCHGEKLVCTVIDLSFARPLVLQLCDLEEKSGTAVALKVLDVLLNTPNASDKWRKPSDLDRKAAQAQLVGHTTSEYGAKHTCHKCFAKFYDLHGKVKQCPKCKSPVMKME